MSTRSSMGGGTIVNCSGMITEGVSWIKLTEVSDFDFDSSSSGSCRLVSSMTGSSTYCTSSIDLLDYVIFFSFKSIFS